MRFVYIGPFRLPNFDAAAARVLNIGRSLRDSGHEVYFISWGGVLRDEDRCEDGVWRVDGFPYTVTNELPQPRQSTIQRLYNRIRRGTATKRLLINWPDQIDAIITYNNCLCRWLIPYCKRNGIKLINDITEWYSYDELQPIDWFRYAYEMHFRQFKVENKIVISSYLDRYYSATHNIVVPATCDASEGKWRENLEVVHSVLDSFDGLTLIYAGNPARKDLLHRVINAIQRLVIEGRSIRFLILGVTRENYLSRYGAMLRDKNLHKNIVFLGRASQDIVPSYYSISDFMVLLRERTRKSNAGFPTKFSEALTAGTPIIANLTSDIGHYLQDGVTGYVVSEPSEEAFYSVLKNRALPMSRDQIAFMKNNVNRVAKQLDYHAYIDSLNLFMNELK